MPDDTSAPAIDTTLLEPILRELVDVAGWAATLQIVEQHGGTRLWVPDQMDDQHPLAQLVGVDAARCIARRFGGDRPFIPKAQRALRAMRNAAIKANAEGLSVPALARRHGLAERQIYMIRGEEEPTANPTRSLFD